MNSLKLDILSMMESGRKEMENYVIMYSDGDKHEKGVGFLMTKATRRSVIGCWTISDSYTDKTKMQASRYKCDASLCSNFRFFR